MTKEIKILILMVTSVVLIALNIQQRHIKKAVPVSKGATPLLLTESVKSDPKEKASTDDYQKFADLITVARGREEVPSKGDPFRKFDPQQIAKDMPLDISTMVLSGIVIEEDGPTALINDQIFKIGDSIGDFRLEEIRQNEAILSRGAEKFVLRLFKEL